MAKKKTKAKSAKSPVLKPATDVPICNNEVISPTLNVCRLCETKDGPYLNIFEGDKTIANKLHKLLPFTVREDDDLPHKICFRCSAKIEELHEFVQKCTKAQQNLYNAIGKRLYPLKNELWVDKLKESHMSSDEICEQIVKKAMIFFSENPSTLNAVDNEEEMKLERRQSLKREAKIATKAEVKELHDSVPLRELSARKDSKTSNATLDIIESPAEPKIKKGKKSIDTIDKKQEVQSQQPLEVKEKLVSKNLLSFDYEESEASNEATTDVTDETPKKEEKPFDIMDHISTIKVNGVGILFQCKLCNRNFLKKEVVLVHGCAKSGKSEVRKSTPPPDPPKVTPNTVKYINTKTDKEVKKPAEHHNKHEEINKSEIKAKPRIGPASRVKRNDGESSPSVGMMVHPRAPTPPPNPNTTAGSSVNPTVQFPTMPSLNSRYKLVPGPNNTFSLIEDPNSILVDQDVPTDKSNKQSSEEIKAFLKTRPGLDLVRREDTSKNETTNSEEKSSLLITPLDKKRRKPADRMIRLEPRAKMSKSEADDLSPEASNSKASANQPYPIGIYQSSQHINQPVPAVNQPVTTQPPFTTPAMRKQSYTVVQTGNPSKLLISTRPTLKPVPTPPEEIKRKVRAMKSSVSPAAATQVEQPFKVTLEDATPKTSGFFTYVNIDPLLRPSHVVLPVDEIIQESQISTSTSIEKNKSKRVEKADCSYACNLCSEKFSREKKLLAHIQAHYSKMDEEDQVRERPNKKRK